MEETKKKKGNSRSTGRGLVKSVMDSGTMIRISYVWIARYRGREMDGWMDRAQTDKWVDGWMDGWMDGYIDRYRERCTNYILIEKRQL